jgi:N6-adenosine-specific RNA methylase IME4
MRRRATEGTAPLEPFRTIVADPGWPYGDKLPGKKRGASKNYKTMRVDEIARYLGGAEMLEELAEQGRRSHPLIAKDARLFLWRVAPMQEEALHVMRAWGFGVPVSELVWCKTTKEDDELLNMIVKFHRGSSDTWEPSTLPTLLHKLRAIDFGMGRTFRMGHETCLVGKRGRPLRLSASERSVLFAPIRAHSEKPEEFFERVERISPGPYLELFSGGHRRPGWTCLGEAHRETTD